MSLLDEPEPPAAHHPSVPVRSKARDRHRDYYLALARESSGDVAEIDKALDQIRQAISSSTDYLAVQEAATNLEVYLYQKGLWDEQLQIAHQLLTIASSSGDYDEHWMALDMVGRCLIRLGAWDYAQTCYNALLAAAETRNDPEAQVAAHKQIGYLHERREQWDQAVEQYQHCLVLLHAQGDDAAIAEFRAKIDRSEFAAGRGLSATSVLSDLEARCYQEPDHPRKAEILREIGDLHRSLGQLEDALDFYQRSAHVCEQCGHLTGLARAKLAVGELAAKLNRFDDALAFLNNALLLYQQSGNRTEAAYVLLSMGDVHERLDQYDLAFERYRQAALIFEEAGDLPFLSLALGSVADLHAKLHHLPEARAFVQRAIAIDEALRLPSLELHQARLAQMQDP